MTYCYNKLWKTLIDKNLSKTDMRKQTGISTNMLAKMGKGKPISMDALARIGIFLNCGLDDIVEFIDEGTSLDIIKTASNISNATKRNWKKLNTNSLGRLEKRANKKASKRRILPTEYFTNKNNVTVVQKLLDDINNNDYNIFSVVLSLGYNLLAKAGLSDKRHVITTLSKYSDIAVIDELTNIKLPDDEYDVIGLVYQCLLQEGKKNSIGSYYTPKQLARNITEKFDFTNGQCFLDPCCGSGAFLLAVKANNPTQLYGADNDRIAVLIAEINMLLKFPHHSFIPQVYCLDYLKEHKQGISDVKFNYIATNPPWGALSDNVDIGEIISKETFSYFFVKAFNQLKSNGTIRFIFPESILNVKTHKDIRQFIVQKTGLIGVTLYDDAFSGVATNYIDIECSKRSCEDFFILNTPSGLRQIETKTIYETENLVFNFLGSNDISIVQTVKNKGEFSLKNSTWALGIVTGDNKNKLSTYQQSNMEKIYTGKEIQPYTLKPAQNYIVYDRNQLQQVAKDEIYRAPEKLVYKFISNKLVFAYDNSKSLFLNSANILIPNIPNMSVKTVMAFLNSSLFQYMYLKLFGEVKILKGNLIELPFPQITESDNHILTYMVNEILNGDNSKRDDIEQYIFSLYGISQDEISYIQKFV